jgi:hypothetical protein
VLAHVVAQVALRRELASVFDTLFMSDGPEIVLRPPAFYGDLQRAPDFGAAATIVRRHGDTLIGVYCPGRDELRLSPPAARPLPLEPGDQVVVLATS